MTAASMCSQEVTGGSPTPIRFGASGLRIVPRFRSSAARARWLARQPAARPRGRDGSPDSRRIDSAASSSDAAPCRAKWTYGAGKRGGTTRQVVEGFSFSIKSVGHESGSASFG